MPPQRKPNVVGLNLFNQVVSERDELNASLDRALSNSRQLKAEVDALKKEASDLRSSLDGARLHAKEQEIRAAKAIGYAESLVDRLYPPRPEMPWAETDAGDVSYSIGYRS